MTSQLDLWSNRRSNSNFNCRNGFLGVDYIGLDTSYDKIEEFTQNVRGASPPPRGGQPSSTAHGDVRPQIFSRNQKILPKEACMPKIKPLAQKLWICTPTLSFSYLWPVNSICSQTEVQIPKFDCINGFLGVDYIGLDTLYDKI